MQDRNKVYDRPQVNARVEPETWKALHKFCYENRTNKTAVIEAALQQFLKIKN